MDLGGRNKGARAQINITPLIDVVLVLLIIFMVLKQTTLNKVTASVPSKSDDPAPQTTRQIVLTVRAGGQLSLDDHPVAPASLAHQVSERLRLDGPKAVFFQIDDAVPYGEAMKVMDAVKGVGARVLAIVTKD
jgi:biopolymer transport protein ExbD